MRLALVACLLATPALAASDEVCKPYATALLNNQMVWLWNRAYSHCSNMEEASPVPPNPGEWRAALDILDPDRTPIIPLNRENLANMGSIPATEKPKVSVPVSVTPDWQAKCKATHPAGYKDGTYNTAIKGKWVRVPCPK